MSANIFIAPSEKNVGELRDTLYKALTGDKLAGVPKGNVRKNLLESAECMAEMLDSLGLTSSKVKGIERGLYAFEREWTRNFKINKTPVRLEIAKKNSKVIVTVGDKHNYIAFISEKYGNVRSESIMVADQNAPFKEEDMDYGGIKGQWLVVARTLLGKTNGK